MVFLCILHHTHPPKRIICNFKTHYHIKGIQYVVIDRGNLEIKRNRQSSPKSRVVLLIRTTERLPSLKGTETVCTWYGGPPVLQDRSGETLGMEVSICRSAVMQSGIGFGMWISFSEVTAVVISQDNVCFQSTCGFKVTNMSFKNNVELPKIIMLACLT